MAEDRRTKAQLLADLTAAQTALSETNDRLAKVERRLQAEDPGPVPVAEAISRCVRALDRLKDSRRDYGRNAEVENVITLLCDRYGVKRVETVTEPCHRRHIEDLTATDVMNAVQGQIASTEVYA